MAAPGGPAEWKERCAELGSVGERLLSTRNMAAKNTLLTPKVAEGQELSTEGTDLLHALEAMAS